MRGPFKFTRRPLHLHAAGPLLLFLLVLALARMGLPEYSHWRHPVALRGADGLPGAMLFNFGVFLLPGLWLLAEAHGLRRYLREQGWAMRIGLTLCQLSVLAFAMQGVLPLDAADLEGDASRLHALVWMLWWIAFVPGALLLAIGLRRQRGFAGMTVCAALLLPLLTVLLPLGAWAALAQRLAFVLWLGWWWLAVVWLGRPPVAVAAPSRSAKG